MFLFGLFCLSVYLSVFCLSVCFFVCMLVFLYVLLSGRMRDYSKSNGRICMKLSPEVCIGLMEIPFNVGDDPDS